MNKQKVWGSMKDLIKGLHKFQQEVFPEQKELFENLVQGQKPEILFITCADSRINPNLVTSTQPGDMFILRNAGNIVPNPHLAKLSGEWATIEFAVFQLEVEHIIICGHSHCGAIQAAVKPEFSTDVPHLEQWVTTNINPTVDLIRSNYADLDPFAFTNILVQENVLQQIENLKLHPGLNKLLLQGKVKLHAWVYEFETAHMYSYNPAQGQFLPLKKY